MQTLLCGGNVDSQKRRVDGEEFQKRNTAADDAIVVEMSDGQLVGFLCRFGNTVGYSKKKVLQ